MMVQHTHSSILSEIGTMACRHLRRLKRQVILSCLHRFISSRDAERRKSKVPKLDPLHKCTNCIITCVLSSFISLCCEHYW
jgi:hypothetical protein